MTDLLRQAILKIEKLPSDQQDALAARILADLEDEQAWEERFNATTDEQWDRLAELAKEEIAGGHTVPLDDVFPVDSSQQ